ncbi:MAG TPA: OB-fold domain-containing protein [Actinoplanes sp.]|jgi:hypothetical protein
MDKPMPEPTPVTQPFWDALKEHRVRIQYSPSAGQYVFYPRVLAPRTLADDLEWRDVSGDATLYTFTVTDRATAPPWQDSVPQLMAVVELDEGPRVTTEMVGVDPASLQVGMRVKPVFEDHPDDGVTLLKYTTA